MTEWPAPPIPPPENPSERPRLFKLTYQCSGTDTEKRARVREFLSKLWPYRKDVGPLEVHMVETGRLDVVILSNQMLVQLLQKNLNSYEYVGIEEIGVSDGKKKAAGD